MPVPARTYVATASGAGTCEDDGGREAQAAGQHQHAADHHRAAVGQRAGEAGLQPAGRRPREADPGQREAGDAGAQAPALLQDEDDVGLPAEEGTAQQATGPDHRGEATPQGERACRHQAGHGDQGDGCGRDHEQGHGVAAGPEHLQTQHGHRGDDRPDQSRARGGHAGGTRVEPAQRRRDQGRGRRDHHDDAEEHPAPAGDVGDVRRQGRPEERRQHPGRREAGEDRRLQGGGEDQADQDVQAHRQGAAAQSLEDPAGDQDLHARSESADDETRRRRGPARARAGPRAHGGRSSRLPRPSRPRRWRGGRRTTRRRARRRRAGRPPSASRW